MSDLVRRLGSELTAAAERQAAADARTLRRWRGHRPHWPARRSGRLLLLAGAAVALGGAGGAAGLLAGRGEVGGPSTLTYARLTPEQRAAGLDERTRPVVIGRGRLPVSGRRWQLVAFQTTRGLCIAIDFPGIANMGGGCGSDRPRQRRLIDWQGYLTRLGSVSPAAVVGAVTPAAARVTVTGGYRAARVARPATIVRVDDRRVLDAIEVRRPFAYYVGETVGGNPIAASAAFGANGRRLGRAGIPNGGAGSAGFRLPEGSCTPADPLRAPVRRVAIPLAASVLERFALLRRPQQAGDRPTSVVRRIEQDPLWRIARGELDLARMRLLTPGRGRHARYMIVTRPRRFPPLPADCLRTLTPRLRAVERHNERAMARQAETVYLSIVDGRGHEVVGAAADDPFNRFGYASRGTSKGPAIVSGLVPDGVATVELRFRGGVRRTAVVRENAFAVEVPANVGATRVVGQVWRDDAGRVVHRQLRR